MYLLKNTLKWFWVVMVFSFLSEAALYTDSTSTDITDQADAESVDSSYLPGLAADSSFKKTKSKNYIHELATGAHSITERQSLLREFVLGNISPYLEDMDEDNTKGSKFKKLEKHPDIHERTSRHQRRLKRIWDLSNNNGDEKKGYVQLPKKKSIENLTWTKRLITHEKALSHDKLNHSKPLVSRHMKNKTSQKHAFVQTLPNRTKNVPKKSFLEQKAVFKDNSNKISKTNNSSVSETKIGSGYHLKSAEKLSVRNQKYFLLENKGMDQLGVKKSVQPNERSVLTKTHNQHEQPSRSPLKSKRLIQNEKKLVLENKSSTEAKTFEKTAESHVDVNNEEDGFQTVYYPEVSPVSSETGFSEIYPDLEIQFTNNELSSNDVRDNSLEEATSERDTASIDSRNSNNYRMKQNIKATPSDHDQARRMGITSTTSQAEHLIGGSQKLSTSSSLVSQKAKEIQYDDVEKNPLHQDYNTIKQNSKTVHADPDNQAKRMGLTLRTSHAEHGGSQKLSSSSRVSQKTKEKQKYDVDKNTLHQNLKVRTNKRNVNSHQHSNSILSKNLNGKVTKKRQEFKLLKYSSNNGPDTGKEGFDGDIDDDMDADGLVGNADGGQEILDEIQKQDKIGNLANEEEADEEENDSSDEMQENRPNIDVEGEEVEMRGILMEENENDKVNGKKHTSVYNGNVEKNSVTDSKHGFVNTKQATEDQDLRRYGFKKNTMYQKEKRMDKFGDIGSILSNHEIRKENFINHNMRKFNALKKNRAKYLHLNKRRTNNENSKRKGDNGALNLSGRTLNVKVVSSRPKEEKQQKLNVIQKPDSIKTKKLEKDNSAIFLDKLKLNTQASLESVLEKATGKNSQNLNKSYEKARRSRLNYLMNKRNSVLGLDESISDRSKDLSGQNFLKDMLHETLPYKTLSSDVFFKINDEIVRNKSVKQKSLDEHSVKEHMSVKPNTSTGSLKTFNEAKQINLIKNSNLQKQKPFEGVQQSKTLKEKQKLSKVSLSRNVSNTDIDLKTKTKITPNKINKHNILQQEHVESKKSEEKLAHEKSQQEAVNAIVKGDLLDLENKDQETTKLDAPKMMPLSRKATTKRKEGSEFKRKTKENKFHKKKRFSAKSTRGLQNKIIIEQTLPKTGFDLYILRVSPQHRLPKFTAVLQNGQKLIQRRSKNRKKNFSHLKARESHLDYKYGINDSNKNEKSLLQKILDFPVKYLVDFFRPYILGRANPGNMKLRDLGKKMNTVSFDQILIGHNVSKISNKKYIFRNDSKISVKRNFKHHENSRKSISKSLSNGKIVKHNIIESGSSNQTVVNSLDKILTTSDINPHLMTNLEKHKSSKHLRFGKDQREKTLRSRTARKTKPRHKISLLSKRPAHASATKNEILPHYHKRNDTTMLFSNISQTQNKDKRKLRDIHSSPNKNKENKLNSQKIFFDANNSSEQFKKISSYLFIADSGVKTHNLSSISEENLQYHANNISTKGHITDEKNSVKLGNGFKPKAKSEINAATRSFISSKPENVFYENPVVEHIKVFLSDKMLKNEQNLPGEDSKKSFTPRNEETVFSIEHKGDTSERRNKIVSERTPYYIPLTSNTNKVMRDEEEQKKHEMEISFDKKSSMLSDDAYVSISNDMPKPVAKSNEENAVSPRSTILDVKPLLETSLQNYNDNTQTYKSRTKSGDEYLIPFAESSSKLVSQPNSIETVDNMYSNNGVEGLLGYTQDVTSQEISSTDLPYKFHIDQGKRKQGQNLPSQKNSYKFEDKSQTSYKGIFGNMDEDLQKSCMDIGKQDFVDYCPSGWFSYKQFCFLTVEGSNHWSDIPTFCSRSSGKMAMPKSQDVLAFLVDKLASGKEYTNSYFVGLRKKDETWEWIDDTPLSQGLENSEDSDSHSCAVIHEGALRKMPCDTQAGYICELKTGVEALRVLAVGDSLTTGYYNRGKSFHPYSPTLEKLLNKDFHRCFLIELSGENGEQSSHMVQRLSYYLNTEQRTFNWVIIFAGTNDLILNSSSGENIADQIIIMHEVVHARGAKSIIVTIPEIFCERTDCANVKERRSLVNERLRTYSEEAGSKSFLSDVALKLSRHRLSLEDRKIFWEPSGVHMKPEGYDKMAKVIFNDLIESIESPS